MNFKDFDLIDFLICLCVLALVTSLTVGLCDRVWRDKAVKQGHAEYYLDDNHNRMWRWKEIPQ